MIQTLFWVVYDKGDEIPDEYKVKDEFEIWKLIYLFSKLFGLDPHDVEENYGLTEVKIYLAIYGQDNAYEKHLIDKIK